MMPKEKWTDDRLDDLNQKVDDGFESVGCIRERWECGRHGWSPKSKKLRGRRASRDGGRPLKEADGWL